MDKKGGWACLRVAILGVSGLLFAACAPVNDVAASASQAASQTAPQKAAVKPAALPPDALSALSPRDVDQEFASVPAPWRAYFLQARRAEQIADPLQRCLAFPDLPENQWPRGFAQAHCNSHFRLLKLSNDDIRGYLDRGDLAGLRARMDAMQARHQAQGAEQGEDIQCFYEDLQATADTDALTARWLALAGDDAYALLARANYLRRAAWDARGKDFASEVTPEGWQRVRQYSREAIPLYRRAAEVAPGLMAIYDGAMDLASISSDDDTKVWALRQGLKQDPACPLLAKVTISTLRPRWGGSYPLMENYQRQLAEHVEQRPLLGLWLQESHADQGRRRVDADQYDSQTLQLLESSLQAGANEDALRDAGSVAMFGTNERWKGLAYVLQSERFQPGQAWAARLVAESLTSVDPAWALLSVSRTAAKEPEPASTQFLLARALAATRHPDLAEQAFQRAMGDPTLHDRALFETAGMWLYPADPAVQPDGKRAEPYIDQILKAQPHSGSGWIMRLDAHAQQRGFIPDELVQNVLKYADRNDPWEKDRAQRLEQAIKGAGNKR